MLFSLTLISFFICYFSLVTSTTYWLACNGWVKHTIVSNVIPLASKITQHKLKGSNYYDWRRTIQLYLVHRMIMRLRSHQKLRKRLGFVMILNFIFKLRLSKVM